MCIRDSLRAADALPELGPGVPAPEKSPNSEGRLGQRRRICLLYTSDAADERSSVDLGGRRIIKKNKVENRRKR